MVHLQAYFFFQSAHANVLEDALTAAYAFGQQSSLTPDSHFAFQVISKVLGDQAGASPISREVTSCWQLSQALALQDLDVHATQPISMQHRMLMTGVEASPASQVCGSAPVAPQRFPRSHSRRTQPQPPSCPEGATCGVERKFKTCVPLPPLHCHPKTDSCLQPKYLLPWSSLTVRLRCVMLGSCLLSVWNRQGLARTSIKFDHALHIQGTGLRLSGESEIAL
jgi:hypothetical protein